VSTPQRILIVRLGAMGDIIHAIPAVALLRAMLPNVEIGWVIEARWTELLRSQAQAVPLSADQPLVDFMHVVDTRKWRKNLLGMESRRQAMSALREVRAKKYELAIDFQGAIKSAVVAKLSGAPKIYGFADAWEKPASLLYTNPVYTQRKHVVERNIDLVAALNLPEPPEGRFTPVLPAPNCEWSEQKLRQLGLSERFAILNPGAGWGAKQWPVDRYAQVARALATNGLRSLVNFGPGEESLADIVVKGSEGAAVAAQFTISQLIAITMRSKLFIGGDTGPMHLAALSQIPVVALFGPTDPARTGPHATRSVVLRDPSSITSHKRNRATEVGLNSITAEQVIAAARELLGKGEGA